MTYLPEEIKIWDSSWKEVDKMRKINIDRVLARPKNAGGLYGVTPKGRAKQY
jgi:hypothetical protein